MNTNQLISLVTYAWPDQDIRQSTKGLGHIDVQMFAISFNT